jgi:hypothetical protein
LGFAFLVLLTGFNADAKIKDNPVLVDVFCGQHSINVALSYKGDPLIIEVHGTCYEDVVINRDNVVLRGGRYGPGAVVAASSTAILLDQASNVSIENLTVQGGIEGPGEMGGAGVGVWFSTGVSVSDVVVELGESKGMTVVGSKVTISDSTFRNNSGYGLQGNASVLVFLEGEVDLSGNENEGLLLSYQSSLISLAAVRANSNGESGIALGQNSSATFYEHVEVIGNDLDGIIVAQGSVVDLWGIEAYDNEDGMVAMTGGQIHIDEDGEPANVHENTNNGLSATGGGFFEFHGTVESNGGYGVYLHGSSATFHNSTIQGHTPDVSLLFGSRVDFEGTNTVDDVVCDGTVLVEGDVSCFPDFENDEHCWDVSNPDLGTSARLILHVMKLGDGHHLCTGVVIVTDPISYQTSVFGNAEYLAGEFHMTLSLAGTRNGVIGIDMTKARLDADTLDGTFEHIGVYDGAVEISSGTLVYTSCE